MKKRIFRFKFFAYFSSAILLVVLGVLGCAQYLEKNENANKSKNLLKAAAPAPVSLNDIYENLNPLYENIAFAKPEVNILRGDNWFLQTPNIWGFNLDDYSTVFCDKKGARPGGGTTPCDPCFNLPTCTTDADCKTASTPAGFPVTCELPDFVSSPSFSNIPITCLNGSTLDTTQKVCMSRAQNILEGFYAAIVSAQSTIDITDLSPGQPILTDQDFRDFSNSAFAPPDAIFYAIKKGLTDLSNTDRAVIVRILGGTYPTVLPSKEVKDFLTLLTSDFNPNNQLTIVVVPHRTCPTQVSFPDTGCGNVYQSTDDTFDFAWNHGKILNVDKAILFAGGQNFYGYDYLLTDKLAKGQAHHFLPVNDALIRYEGPIALGASTFVDTLFKYVRQTPGEDSNFCAIYTANNGISTEDTCSEKWTSIDIQPRSIEPQLGDIDVLSMYTSKLSSLNNKIIDGVHFAQAADISEPARAYAMSHAIKNVKVSQQSLFIQGRSAFHPTGDGSFWPENPGMTNLPNPNITMEAIVSVFDNNLKKEQGINNRTVQIVTTSTPQTDGYGSYVDLNHAFQYMCRSLEARGHSKATAQAELNKNLQLGYFSYKNESTAQGGPAQHNKFWSVDDNIFYFGSHNFYPSSLQQFGVINEGTTVVSEVMTTFWEPLWNNADTSRFNTPTAKCE